MCGRPGGSWRGEGGQLHHKTIARTHLILTGWLLWLCGWREYCLCNHLECENLSHVPIDPKPRKQRHCEIHHLLRTRDDHRSAFKAAKPMPLSAMVPLEAIRVGFAHDQ